MPALLHRRPRPPLLPVGRRSRDDVKMLQDLADRVQMLHHDTGWIDLWSWSGRRRDKTPIGGPFASATYHGARMAPPPLLASLRTGGQINPQSLRLYTLAAPSPLYTHWLQPP